MPQRVELNETWTPKVTFTANGVATDPTTDTMIITITAPDGTVTTLTWNDDAAAVRESAGVFHTAIVCNQKGLWEAEFSGQFTSGAETFTVKEKRHAIAGDIDD